MIKTVQYNDFTEIDNELFYDKQKILDLLLNFYKDGGNINYPVKKSAYDKLENAEEFFRVHFKDIDIMKYLIDNVGLENPFSWSIENNTIIENPLYGNYWYRDNTKFYEDYAAEGFSKFLHYLIDNKIEPDTYREINTYDSGLINRKDPLIYLVDKLNNPSVYDSFFTLMPQYKEVYQEKYKTYSNKKMYKIEQSIATTLVFFKHGINKEAFLDPENVHLLHEIIQHAVYKNDIEFLQKYCADVNLAQLEKDNKLYSCFLKYCHTSEMANYLIEKNCFIAGDFNGTYSTIFPSEYLTNKITIDTILQKKPEYQSLVNQHYKQCYENYFNNTNQDVMTLLIDKYNYPVEKVDLLSVAVNIWEQDGVIWALNKGADPRNCNKLITNAVRDREDGLSLLKKIHKEGHINIFNPDPIYEILNNAPTKIFYNWLEKVDKEQLSRITKNGLPCWWSTNITSINFISKKIGDFNQLDEQGNSWLFYLAKNIKYHTYNYNEPIINIFNKHVKKNPDSFLTLCGHDSNNDNIFHLLLKNSEVNAELIHIISQSSNYDATQCLTEKNNDGLSVIDLVLNQDSNNTRNNNILFNIVNGSPDNFDFEIQFKEQKAIDFFREVFKDNNTKLSIINNHYLSNLVNNNCEAALVTKKMKI